MNETTQLKFENNERMGDKLVELIKNGFENESEEILEYDFQIVPDETVFCSIEQRKYILLNKAFLKKFYAEWRNKYFALDTNDDLQCDVASLVLLIVNPNFASAWSKRKKILLNNFNSNNIKIKGKLLKEKYENFCREQ